MMLSARPLLAAIALCYFAATLAIPMDGFATSHKCRCLKTTTDVIPMQLFRRIEIVPPGPNCRKTEILITKKDDCIVCVAPEAKWISGIISKVMQKRKRTMASPTSTST